MENPHENLFEALKVPVLVNDGVDNSRKEYLVGFVGKQKHQVVHFIDLLEILPVFNAPLRQNLLADQVNQILDVGVSSQVDVFLWVLETNLDFVDQRATH